MPTSPRLASASRSSVFALPGALVLFSAACLGIDDPKQAQDGDCRQFLCTDGVCDELNMDFGTTCKPSMICDGEGACKLASRSPCTKDDECASHACVAGTCKSNTLGACENELDCKSGLCYENACRLPYGNACAGEAQCLPGHCVGNVCRLPDSSGCASSSECASGVCFDGICRRSDGSHCDVNTDCASGTCGSDMTCLLSATKNCQSNADCASNFCLNYTCVAQSCAGLAANCGINQNEYCCDAPVVPGGTYNRSNDMDAPTTLSDFRLDRFEVTVARFRRFVDAYPDSRPNKSSGQRPNIAESAWKEEWDVHLPATRDELINKTLAQCTDKSTWSATPGPKDTLPINCIDWYLAFAFCAWDGGTLPTESEWNDAAAGGNEQREYPWSNPPNSKTIDATFAVYDCWGGNDPMTCSANDILPVGSKSINGNGRWGHTDLSGSMAEWVLDWFGVDYPYPCTDCAQLTPSMARVLRGGAWDSVEVDVTTSKRMPSTPTLTGAQDMQRHEVGIRCARSADLIKSFR